MFDFDHFKLVRAARLAHGLPVMNAILVRHELTGATVIDNATNIVYHVGSVMHTWHHGWIMVFTLYTWSTKKGWITKKVIWENISSSELDGRDEMKQHFSIKGEQHDGDKTQTVH